MARKNTPKVYKRLPEYDKMLMNVARDLIRENLGDKCLTFLDGYNIYCVDQYRGRFNSLKKMITIPKWTIEKVEKKAKNYWIYYLAHELAHLFDYYDTKCVNPHGANFMKWFMRICPVELQHHEHEYKPRHANAAGVPQRKRSK